MDIDFPLILVALTFVALVIWGLDVVWLRPARRRRDAALRARFPRWSEAGSADALGYAAEAGKALREPVPVVHRQIGRASCRERV